MRCEQDELLTGIYKEYFPKIYNYVYYQVNDHQVCDDLVSSIFMKVVEHIDDFDEGKAAFSTWIFRIARNSVIDHYRKQKHDSNIDDFEETLFCAVSFEEGYRRYVEEERWDVEELVQVLNENEKPVIYWRYFQGLSFREIAQKLDKNDSTVRTLHERALKKMLKFFRDKGIQYEDLL